LNGYLELFVAYDMEQLLKNIDAIDDAVSRPRGRPPKKAEERWIVKRYLQSLDTSALTPPATLFQADGHECPDFILETAAGTWAIEVTELIQATLAKAWATGTDSSSTVSGYIDDEPERLCADLMVERLSFKFNRFSKWDHPSDHRNVVLIYEDTCLPALDMAMVLVKTRQKLTVNRPHNLEVFIRHNEEWHGFE
jgi:hypothetical protein